MSVTVVVPTYNNVDELKACLATLDHQTVSPDLVAVCVDGSSDGTVEFLAEWAGGIRTVRTHPGNIHRGLAATRNLALEDLQTDFVLFLDSDMQLDARAIEAHVDVMRAPNVVSVGRVEYANASTELWAG